MFQKLPPDCLSFVKHQIIQTLQSIFCLSSILQTLSSQWSLEDSCDLNYLFNIVKLCIGCWRDDSVVKSTDCSFKGPEFNSQHRQGSSQLLETPVPGGLISSHKHACRQNTNAYKIKINKLF